jgi:hypothetical protein
MSHLHVLPGQDGDSDRPGCVQPELAERMHAARDHGSVEAALHLWGLKVRASRGADVAWRTTRPEWRYPGRLDNWRSPVWLPTAEAQRRKRRRPLRLSSLFDAA